MKKVFTLRNIIACFCIVTFMSCKNEKDDAIYGQWQVQSLASSNSYVPNVEDQNYSLRIDQTSQDGSSVRVSDENGIQQDASVKYKSGDNMIVEYRDAQTGEKMLVQVKKD